MKKEIAKMKIAVIGAAGKAGSLIVGEALARGHEVTAIARDRAKIAEPKANVLERIVRPDL
jgi:putative NADH-flavin reductase